TEETETAAEGDEGELGELYPDPLPSEAGSTAWLTPAMQQQFVEFSCDSESALDVANAPADKPLITCSDDGVFTYVLGPVELTGDVITDAVAQQRSLQNGQGTTGEWE